MNLREKRIRILNTGKEKKEGFVLYWMSRDQRVNDNYALLHAQDLAKQKNTPVAVLFNVFPKFLNALPRTYEFMLKGLKELQQNLEELNIHFLLIEGDPVKNLASILKNIPVRALVSDFSPLREKQIWNRALKKLCKNTQTPFHEVDTHNIIPVWEASDKKEYAAYTLRKKIKKRLDHFLVQIPALQSHSCSGKIQEEWKNNEEIPSLIELKSDDNWNKFIAKKKDKIKENIERISDDYPKKALSHSLKFIPGEKAAHKVLGEFLENKINRYNEERNDPNKDGTSNLSPYLHFGQISSQRVVLECVKIKDLAGLKSSFYDEIIVRKELSDNFCFYEENYDNFKGFHDWAKNTLNTHRNDPRKYNYSLNDFEFAKTHDDAWNAAQIEMITTGKMHNYMRMYWAKKILEWTSTPEKAQTIAIYLNNKYELDGRDPNGYAGVAWSIGGIHDRAWKERDIYGKVRYMSKNGLKRKFDLEKYMNTYSSLK